MLIHNGFVWRKNRFDSVGLKLGLSKKDVLYEKRSKVLAKFGLKCMETFLITEEAIQSKYDLFNCFLFVKIFISETGF